MKLPRSLIRLYPKHWRRRYEEELLALLEERPLSLSDSLDLLLGVLDAHLHPHLGTTTLELPERMKQMLSTLRYSLLCIFCAYSGFIVVGIDFQKLTEDKAFVDAAQSYTIIGLSFHLVIIGAVIALLATLTGGLPIVAAIIRDALAHRRYTSLLLLATPLIALFVLVSTILLLEALIPANAPPLPTFLSHSTFIATFLGAAVVSTGALCLAVLRSNIPVRLFRFALFPSLLTTLAMAGMLLATLVYGLSLASVAPQLFNSNNGMFGTETAASWLRIVLIMAAATLLALIALVRAISARSALHETLEQTALYNESRSLNSQ